MNELLCRTCGILLTNEATRVMGICGSCLLAAESRGNPMIRPSYGSRVADKPQREPELD